MLLTGVYYSSFPRLTKAESGTEQTPSKCLMSEFIFIILERHVLKHDTQILPVPFTSLSPFPFLLQDFRGATSLEIDTLFHP